MKRLMTLLTIAVLLSATPWVNANPGGNGDANRDFQCGGSCHGDPDLNSSSPAMFEVNIPERIYAGLSAEITVELSSLPQTETGIFGAFLLTSLNANGDIPSNEGWKISSNSNLGQTNYQEQVLTSGSELVFSWTLSNDDIITTDFYVAVNHGSVDNDLAHTGVSQAFQLTTIALPQDMPSVSPGFEPIASRLVGEDTTISIPTQNAEKVTIEIMGSQGNNIEILASMNGSQVWDFTLPQAIRESSLQWRVVVEGEGLTTTSAWYSMVSSEPTFESSSLPIILQGVGVALMGAAFTTVLHKRLNKSKTVKKKYEQTDLIPNETKVNSAPNLPATGLPEGWTMEQWEYYGQDYLDGKLG